MLEKIKLETASGELVAFEGVLPMGQPPEVILWGEGCFVRQGIRPAVRWGDPCENVTYYREGLCIPIPAPLFYVSQFAVQSHASNPAPSTSTISAQ